MALIPLNKGIHRSPSTGVDGEMDVCVDLMPKDGEMRNVPRLRETGWELPSGARFLAVHRVDDSVNLIYAESRAAKKIEVDLDGTPGKTWSLKGDWDLQDGESVIVTLRGTYTERVVGPGGVLTDKVFTFEEDTQITSNSGRGGTFILPTKSSLVIDDAFVNNDKSRLKSYITLDYGDSVGGRKKIRRRISDTQYNTLRWRDDEGEDHDIVYVSGNITGVQTLGNTLVVTADKIYYAMWKDGVYVWLGSEFPMVDMQFRLKGEYASDYHTNILKLDKGTSDKDAMEYVEVLQKGEIERDPFEPTQWEPRHWVIELDNPLSTDLEYRLNFRIYTRHVNIHPEFSVDNSTWEYIEWTTRTDKENTAVTFKPKKAYKYFRARWTTRGQGFQGYYTLFKGKPANSTKFYNRDNDYGESGFNAVIGVANEFVQRHHRDRDKFVYPFLIRYALRLFDGSFVNLSSPCLLVPNDDLAPLVYSPYDELDLDKQPVIYADGVVADIQYQLLRDASLDNWKDIVTDLVVGVTPQCYSYNQGAKFDPSDIAVKILRVTKDSVMESAGSFYGAMGGKCGRWSIDSLRAPVENGKDGLQFLLPKFDDEHIRKEICERGDFHIIKYIKFSDISETDGYETLELDPGTLRGLESREVIDEGAGLRTSYTGSAIKIYNQRVVVGNVSEKLNNGAQPSMLNGFSGNCLDGVETDTQISPYACVTAYSETGRSYTLVRTDTGGLTWGDHFFWLYFPSSNASSMTVYARFVKGETGVWYEATVPLAKHIALDGAYWFDSFDSLPWTECAQDFFPEEVFESDSCFVVSYPGKVIQSKAANPFVFPVSLQSFVTKGEVTALATASLALSEGQFGQFPLYAFCTDGIWSLNFDGAGRLASSQPTSLEQINNVNGICETEQTVFFTTDRGLRMLAGSSVREVAAHMHGPVRLSVYDHGNKETAYLEDFFGTGVDDDFHGLLVTDDRTWIDILRECRMSYDYPNGLLHVYPKQRTGTGYPVVDWHYIVQTDSGEVSVCKSAPPLDICRDLTTDLVTSVSDGVTKICDYQDTEDYSNSYVGFLLTRPVAFGDPLGMKTVDDLRLIASFAYNGEYGRVAVLVSNDRLTWWRLTSLRHHSFKWFRLAVFTEMTDAGRLQGLDVELEQRRRNKIR